MSDERSTPDRPLQSGTRQSEPSLGELFSRLTNDFSTLMRQEVALAKTELKQEAKEAGRAGGLLGGAAVAGYMALLLLSFAAVWGLAVIIPTGFAFLAVGGLYLVVAAVLGLAGKKKAQQVEPPRATIDTVKEDGQWAKSQAKR